MKKGILLVNLVTPDSAETSDVRKYLREFLMDKRVIDIPFFSRWMLVNLIIAPFRSPKSAKEYKKLWTENGSPLMYYGSQVEEKLQNLLGDKYKVALGMRYQNPSIQSALAKLKKEKVEDIVVFPLFPQYASATTGSVHDKVMEIVKDWQIIPTIRFISYYHDHPAFIKAFAEIGKTYLAKQDYDHILFSYHGLPERQLKKADLDYNQCNNPHCPCSEGLSENRYCYRSACFQTTSLLAKELNLSKEKYSSSFQSRLGKDPWIQPYTDETIQNLRKKGVEKLLVFAPSFVADCLETTIEIDEQYRHEFLEAGGKEYAMVESLNDSDGWVEAIKEIILA